MKKLLAFAGAFFVGMLLSSGPLARDAVAVKTAGDAEGDAFRLQVEGYARETLPGAGMSAAYLSFHNSGDGDLQLRGVELPGLEKAVADLHTTVNDGGISRMRPLATLAIPAGAEVRMAPGGVHLMLSGVKLRAGERLLLRLRFAGGITRDVVVPVRGPQPAEEHHHHHG